jgi:hypothetical protein
MRTGWADMTNVLLGARPEELVVGATLTERGVVRAYRRRVRVGFINVVVLPETDLANLVLGSPRRNFQGQVATAGTGEALYPALTRAVVDPAQHRHHSSA